MLTPYGRTFPFDRFMAVMKQAYESYDNVPVVTLIAVRDGDPFKILVSAMLSARTNDKTTVQATARLFKVAGTPQAMAALTVTEIEQLIYPVGFYKTKAPRVKEIAQRILSDFGGKVPESSEELMRLPGVGRKTANLTVNEAYGKEAITVDTHVHRISNRLGIIKTRMPFHTEGDLMKILPRAHWIRYNTYLVAHGQVICKPISPMCSQCAVYDFCKRVGVTTSR